jgi:hypothetical protein
MQKALVLGPGARNCVRWHREMDRLTGDYPMSRVRQLDEYPMRTWFKPDHDHGLAAGVDKMPGRIIDGYVDVANARRHRQSARAKHGHKAQILCPVLDEHGAPCKRFRER